MFALFDEQGKLVSWSIVDKKEDIVPYEEGYEEVNGIDVLDMPYIQKVDGKISVDLEAKKADIPKPDYGMLVEAYIREKYSLSAELAILRQRDTKPAEFEEYNAYAEECKERAKAEIKAVYG